MQIFPVYHASYVKFSLLHTETKGLAMEDAPNVFKHHWFWRHYANRPDADRARDQELLGASSYLSDGTPMYSSSAAVPNGVAHANGTKDTDVRGSPFHGAPFADYPFTDDESDLRGRSSPATTNLYLAGQARGGPVKGAKGHENGGSGLQDNPYSTRRGVQNDSPASSSRGGGVANAYEEPDGEIASLEVVPEPLSNTPRSRLTRREPASDDPIWNE